MSQTHKTMINIAFKHIQTYGIEEGNLSELMELQKQQLLHCAELYFGKEVADKVDTANIQQLFDEEEEGWCDADLYHVIDLDKQEILMDFWHYMVDSGTFFAHNTTNYAGFEMIQFSIDFIEENEFNKNFPENFDEILQNGFKKV